MILPIVPSSGLQRTDNDHRDLLTALKLLSGENCLRDAKQAQVILVGLTESTHTDVADSAKIVMQAGLARDWFEDKTPHFFELHNLAEKAIANFEKGPNRVKQTLAMVVAGLLVFFGVAVYLYTRNMEGGSDAPNYMIIAVAVLTLLILGIFVAFKSKR